MYTKDDIKVGLYMVKDGGPAFIKMSKPRPVRFGDPLPDTDFRATTDLLEQSHARLLKLRDDLRKARR